MWRGEAKSLVRTCPPATRGLALWHGTGLTTFRLKKLVGRVKKRLFGHRFCQRLTCSIPFSDVGVYSLVSRYVINS